MGATTAATLLANAVVPGLVDRYLGRTGYGSQQTDEPADPDRPANLWDPVDVAEDRGAHGAFDDRSHGRSLQWWATSHRGLLAGLAAGAGVATAVAARRERS